MYVLYNSFCSSIDLSNGTIRLTQQYRPSGSEEGRGYLIKYILKHQPIYPKVVSAGYAILYNMSLLSFLDNANRFIIKIKKKWWNTTFPLIQIISKIEKKPLGGAPWKKHFINVKSIEITLNCCKIPLQKNFEGAQVDESCKSPSQLLFNLFVCFIDLSDLISKLTQTALINCLDWLTILWNQVINYRKPLY